jgi:hypothetical protein
MKSRFGFWIVLALVLPFALISREALGFPGVFAGKDGTSRYNQSTQVVVFKKGEFNVVTVMPDYQGPLQPFAWLMPVPPDVKLGDVRTLRRDIVDHLDQISAPRFAEFWEMDQCEPGPAAQEWERNLKVEGPGFLGDGMGGGDKVPRELLVNTTPEFRDSIYKLSLIAPGADVGAWLGQHGYQLSASAAEAIKAYAKMQFLVVEVDTGKIELAGANRAILSPIRYSTKSEVSITSTLGLSNAKDTQELLVYVLEPSRRFEAKNYKNVFAPTNLQVDFKVKERMGEFYAGLYDRLASKNPGAFVLEYAWGTKGCGEPCANAPLSLAELLTLGADAFESTLPDDERNPDPGPLSDKEKEEYQAAKSPADKKQLDTQRKELATRRALIARNENYVLSRLHYRYDKAALPHDIELGAAASAVEGGIDIPKGPNGELPTEVRTAAGQSRLQTRYTSMHPDISVPKCDKPERFRWGKAPRSYRGLRKIWVAQDLATRNRELFKPQEVVITSVPGLDLPGVIQNQTPEVKSEAPAVAPKEAEKANCGCAVPGAATDGGRAALLFGICVFAWSRRRRGGPN